MYQERFEELKHSGKLPSPSSVGMRILVLTQNEECSLEEVVAAIQIDPALTGRVIKLATSVQLGGVKLTTVKEAAVRLGFRTVCNTALGFTVVSGNRRGKCASFDYNHFWASSLAAAVSAEAIARELKSGSAPEAFTFGLLIGIGRLALSSVHPVEYDEVLRRIKEDPKLDLAQLESETFFINHREVSAALLELWGLPAYFSEVALHFDGNTVTGDFDHSETADMLRLLNAAAVMAEVCVSDVERQPHLWPGLRRICQGLNVRSNQICDIFDKVAPQWAEWGQALEVTTNAVLASGELEKQAREHLVRAAARNVEERNEAEDGARKSLRILAVDDDPVSLRVLVSLLKREGHSVLTARNGKEAIAVYLEHGAQVVITDWMMPEIDGLMLCRQLRRMEEGRKLYILILTGRAEEERIVEAFEVGADDYIVKPFKPGLLKARIQPARRVIHLQEEHDAQVRENERVNRQLDIEKRKFKAAAMTDALTELPNRRHAIDRLENLWANSRRAEAPFSVVMLDVDFFKRVNDTWGHDVGDAVLKSIALAVQGVLRRGDMCARMGGEEFLVICPNTGSDEGAMRVAERIRKAVEANRTIVGQFDGKVTVSLGVALADDEVGSIDALLKIADEAVYAAKAAGRNRAVLGNSPGSERKSA